MYIRAADGRIYGPADLELSGNGFKSTAFCPNDADPMQQR